MSPNCSPPYASSFPPGAVIYDVGANIGYVSLLLAKAAGEAGKVFAFEALPSNVDQLRRNVALNAMEKRVTVIDRAVTQATGPVRFLVHASGGMGKVAGSAGREDKYESEVTVPGISLDEFVYGQGNPPPQVVKMDIEGGEVLALPGMQPGADRSAPAYADGTARTRIQPGCLGDAYRCRLRNLLDAPRLPGHPLAGGAGLEGIYRGETTYHKREPGDMIQISRETCPPAARSHALPCRFLRCAGCRL